MSLVLLSLVLPSLRVTPVKIGISDLMYVTDDTVTGVTLWVTPVKIGISDLMYVTDDTVTGVTFLTGITSKDQFIRYYLCNWCYCHWFLLSLVLPSLRVTPVKISLSGLVCVTGVTVTGVTFLIDNNRDLSE